MLDLTRNECFPISIHADYLSVKFSKYFFSGLDYPKHPLIQSNSLNKVVKIPHKKEENMTIIKLRALVRPNLLHSLCHFFSVVIFSSIIKFYLGHENFLWWFAHIFLPVASHSALLAHIDAYFVVVSVGFCLLLFDLTCIRMAIDVCTEHTDIFPSSLFWGCSLVDVCVRAQNPRIVAFGQRQKILLKQHTISFNTY